MYTLGINAAYHDSSACLVQDGVVVAAAEEERFTRIKHAKRPVPFSAWELPWHAVDFCLARAGIDLAAVDHIAYAYDPQALREDGRAPITSLPLEPSAHAIPSGWDSPWEPLFLAYVINAPRQLLDGVPHHLERRFRRGARGFHYRWHFIDHHLAHEASAFLPSPFEQAAILTMDGRGERATTSFAVGEGNALRRLGQVDLPHSLGLLYEEVTRYLGFLHSSDEYKVMALASFGAPRYRDVFREILSCLPGGYRVEPARLVERFGPARRRGEPLTALHFDLARSLQEALEETVLGLAGWLFEQTGQSRLCMAGGVALNCVMNGRLRREGPFSQIWVQPAAGDAGTALGAGLLVDARERDDDVRRWSMDHAFLGPSYTDAEIEAVLRRSGLRYQLMDSLDDVAALLEADRIIAWFHGAMEFGPRALGARSILASPISDTMQARLNELKDREDFRPVAPVVLEEEAGAWFRGCTASPFMLFTYDVVPEKRARIPAVAHVDGSARVQTIRRAQHPAYYDLLRAFRARTGVPVLVNTSFNTRGAPIVCTPRDALESFVSSPLDALVLGSYLLVKRELLNDAPSQRRHSDVSASVPA